MFKFLSKLVQRIIFILLGSLSLVVCAFAEEEGADTNLFGDWGGVRSSLESSGIKVESILTNDYMANVSGGLRRRSATLGDFDLTATVDTTKAGLWSDGTLFAYFVGTYGNELSRYVGDSQASDNIEAYSTAKLFEFWYDQSMIDGKLSFLVGLHDFNSEFNSLEYAGGLINSSFGIQRDVSQVGPSVFNTAALALRIKVLPTESTYIQSALYDGIPGDPNNQRGTRIRFKSGDGVFWGSELGVQRPTGSSDGRYYKAGVGFWYHTAQFENFDGAEQNRNHGLYGIGEFMLLPEEEGSEQGLGIFGQYGHPRSNRNVVGQYIGFGLSYTGLIPDRDDDQFCVGYARAENSNDFMAANPGLQRAETAIEFTYIAKVLPYLSLQPDIQFILNPSTDPAASDAVVIGVRAQVAL